MGLVLQDADNIHRPLFFRPCGYNTGFPHAHHHAEMGGRYLFAVRISPRKFGVALLLFVDRMVLPIQPRAQARCC